MGWVALLLTHRTVPRASPALLVASPEQGRNQIYSFLKNKIIYLLMKERKRERFVIPFIYAFIVDLVCSLTRDQTQNPGLTY